MYSFTICLLILIIGYFVYGRYAERVFGPDAVRATPALTKADGGDSITRLEDFYDSVFEYCRPGTYFRGYYGC